MKVSEQLYEKIKWQPSLSISETVFAIVVVCWCGDGRLVRVREREIL